MPDDVKLISVEMIVGEETITALYQDPEKIAGMLAEEQSLGGFLRELRDMEPEEEHDTEVDTFVQPHQISEREVELITEFEKLVDRMDYTPMEIRGFICGIAAGFAHKSGIDLDQLHDDIDSAYNYRTAHPPGRPS